MKTTLRNLPGIAFLAIISVTLLTIASVFATAAENKPALKKKELMALLTNAKTPADRCLLPIRSPAPIRHLQRPL